MGTFSSTRKTKSGLIYLELPMADMPAPKSPLGISLSILVTIHGNNEMNISNNFSIIFSREEVSHLEEIIVHMANKINEYFDIDPNIIKDKVAGMSLTIAPVSKTFGLTLAQTVALITACYIINEKSEDTSWINAMLFRLMDRNEKFRNAVSLLGISDDFLEKGIAQKPQATLLEFLEHLVTFHGDNSEEAIEKMYCDLFGISNKDYIHTFIMNFEIYRDNLKSLPCRWSK